MNKQIEEMAEDLWRNTLIHSDELCEKVAEYLYNAGYRKQEWISVEDRLPNRVGKYLVFTFDRRVYLCDFIDHYCDGNMQFDDYRVTHWMPIPKAPQMKGEET